MILTNRFDNESTFARDIHNICVILLLTAYSYNIGFARHNLKPSPKQVGVNHAIESI